MKICSEIGSVFLNRYFKETLNIIIIRVTRTIYFCENLFTIYVHGFCKILSKKLAENTTNKNINGLLE